MVANYTRGPGFESSHGKNFIEQLFTVCIKDENKEIEARNDT